MTPPSFNNSQTSPSRDAWSGALRQMQPLAWSTAVRSLHPDTLKFALNAAVDTLPHNANLYLWQKKDSDRCPLCSADSQNLVHVLNSCKVALELRRYNKRHDAVLQVIAEVVKEAIPTTASISVDKHRPTP